MLDVLERLFPLPRRLDLVSFRVVVPVRNHGLQGREKRSGILSLRRFDEIQRVPLVSVGVEVFDYGLADRSAAGMLLQRVHQASGRGGDHQFPKRFVRLDPLRDLVHGRVREHGSRLVPAQELAAGEMAVGQVFLQEGLQLTVRRLRDPEGVAGIVGPVVAFSDGEPVDTLKQSFGFGHCGIDLAPRLDGSEEPGHGLIVPLTKDAFVHLGLVERRIGRVVALGHGHRVGQVLDPGGCGPIVERLALLARQGIEEQLHVVLLHGGIGLLKLPSLFLGFAFGGFQLVLGQPLGASPGLKLRPIRPLIGEAVQRHEYGTAAHHEAFAPARVFQSLRQVQLLEQRTDGIGHVLDDLAPVEDFRWRVGLPDHLYGLRRQVRDGLGLQQPQFAFRDGPFNVLRNAVVERFDLDSRGAERFKHVIGQRRPGALF